MDPFRKTQVVAVLWAVVLLLWPKPSNIRSVSEGKSSGLGSQGLYKAAITKAGFGLLGVQYYESSQGKKHWHIESKFAELHRKENYAFLTDVIARFFAERTGNEILTQSDYGRSWTDKNLVELEGHVRIHSKKGFLFTMDKLLYHSDSHEFLSRERVHMRGPDVKRPTMLLQGTGLIADIDREHFHLQNNVSGQRRLKDSKWMKIQSRSGDFFTDESRAVFQEKVKSEMPKAKIECDVFELHMSNDDESVLAQGNVVLYSKDRKGYAESALIQLNGNEILLEGKARVESKDNLIQGKRIYLYTDDDRIDVEEATGRVNEEGAP